MSHSIKQILKLEGRRFWAAAFKHINNQDIRWEMESRGAQWKTCACCALNDTRRVVKDSPINWELVSHGLKFYALVIDGHYYKARMLYNRIQKLVDKENSKMGTDIS